MSIERLSSNNLDDYLEKMFSKKEINDIRGAFDLFDKDGNNIISKDEIRQILEGFGEYLSDEELEDIIKKHDVDGDGEFGFYDFVMTFYNKSRPVDGTEEDEELRRAFEMCDISRTGFINIFDLKYVFKCIGEPVTTDELLEMIAEADTNFDDRIDFNEFVACLKREEENGPGDG